MSLNTIIYGLIELETSLDNILANDADLNLGPIQLSSFATLFQNVTHFPSLLGESILDRPHLVDHPIISTWLP